MTKQNSFTKKVFSLLLSLAMVLTMMPAAAFAEDDIAVQSGENNIAVQANTANVAEVTIDGTATQYTDINEAFTAAKGSEGGTVKLLQNVTTEKQILVESGTSFTLDLNGKKLDRSTGNTLQVGGGSVTVTSSNGTGTISNDVNNAIYVANNATVHVTSGVRLNRLYAMDAANLTLDVGVIITDRFSTKADNVAPFLAGKALQKCDADGKKTDGQYVSIYQDYNGTDTGCVIVIEHTRCEGTPSEGNPCEICGYNGTQTKPTEPVDPNVAEIKDTGTKYKTLAEAIKAASGAEITLLEVFGENVVVEDSSITASIILGTGGTIRDGGKEYTYPSYWIAASHGIPLTMNAGEITLKSGVLAQFCTGAGNDIAIKLNGGTLTVEGSVTKIIGGSVSDSADNTAQMAAIEATGGTLDLQGNTHLDGGLIMRDNAKLANKLTAGIFTNSGSSTASVSVKGNTSSHPQVPDSTEYSTVFDLLAEGYAFAKYDKDTDKAGDVIAKNDTKSLTEDVTVIKCEHKDANNPSLFEDGTCKGCGFTCEHTNIENNKCSVCGAQMAAKISDSYFTTLAAAIKAATNNGTVTLLADVEENITIADGTDVTIDLNEKTWKGSGTDRHAAVPLTVSGGNVTVQNGTLNQGGASSFANHAVIVNGGSLTVGGDMTIRGANYDSDNYCSAIDVQSGQLTLRVGTNLIFGMSVPEGKQLKDYLSMDTAFQQAEHRYSDDGDYFDSESAQIINGYVKEKTGDFMLTVVEHTHFVGSDNKCACGFTCAHSSFTNGKCTVCDYECTHPSATEAADGTYTCSDCEQQMVVKVEMNGESTYYAARHNGYNDETLWWLFNNALESGSTVTLLADNLVAWAYVSNGKQITLNLNGKTLEETSQGITVGRDNYKDTTSTNNKLIVTGTLGAGEVAKDNCYAFRTWEGGELNLKEVADGGKIGSIIADGGKVTTEGSTNDIKIGTLHINDGSTQLSLKGGNFDKICVSDGVNVKLGDLLANKNPIQKSGKAFKYTTGDEAFVPYDTVIDSGNAVENVTITDCPHDSITSGTNSDGITCGICGYCGMDNIAAVLTKPDGSIQTYTINNGSSEIFNPLSSTGGTLKLYSDLTCDETLGTQGGTTEMVIDLNGHTISLSTGQEVTLNGGSLTITDSSSDKDKKGRFAVTLRVYYTASLTVDGVAMGTIGLMDNTASITLKENTTFTAIDASVAKCRIVEFLQEGCYIVDDSNTAVDLTPTSINSENGFTVKQLPGTVTADKKTGEIRYGSNKIADDLLPTVTMNDESKPQLTYEWYYNTDSGAKKLITITKSEDSTVYNMERDAWNNLSVGDKLDVFCIISAETVENPWKTPVTGYTLTVTAGDLAEASIDLTGSNNPVYTPGGYGNCYQQTLKFRVSHNGTILTEGTDYQIMNDSNHGYEAGKYTLVLEGLGKYAGSKLEYKWEVAKRELTGIAKITKTYDGTDALPDQITFAYDGGEVTLTCDGDYEATGGYYSAGALASKDANAKITLKNTNYTFANDETTKKFFTSESISKAEITKAAAPSDIEEGTITVYNNRTADYSYDVPKELLPKLADGKRYGNEIYTSTWNGTDDSYKVTTSGIGEHGQLFLRVKAPDVNDEKQIGSFTITVKSENYEDFTLTVNVNAVNKLTPTGSPTLSENEITYGNSVNTISLSGDMAHGEDTVSGSFKWIDGNATPDTGSYEAEWKFTPDRDIYKEVAGKTTITVKKATLTGVSVQQTGALEYNGNAQTATVVTNATAVNGQTVTFTYSDSEDGTYSNKVPAFTDAGTYTVYYKAEAPNHETATGSFTVTIAARKLTIKEVKIKNKVYDGKDTAEIDTVTFDGLVGTDTVEYTASDVKFSSADVATEKKVTGTITLNKDVKNYVLTDGNFTAKANISKADATCTAPTAEILTYNGKEQELVKAGTAGGGKLVYSTEENGTYSTAIPTGKDAGNYTVWYKVAGDDNHNDTAPVKLEVIIQAKTVTDTVTVERNSFIYNGEAHTPEVTVKDGDTVIDSSEYSVSYSDNTNAGEATVTVTDKEGGNYTVSGSITFTIEKCSIKDADITLDGSLTYTGSQQTKHVKSVTVQNDGKAIALTENDYTLTGNTRTNAGDYTLTVTGTGNFTGTATKGFTIAKATVTTTDKPMQNSIYAGTDVSAVTFKTNETSKKNEVTVNFNGNEVKLEGTWSITEAKDAEGKEITKFDKAGKYTCTATFTPEDPNFAPIIIDGIEITVTNKPSGGGAVIPASEVTTDKTGTADEKATTSPAEVKTETKTGADGSTETVSKVTVSDANQKEIIKQVKDNKSEEIIIKVSDKDVKDGTKLELDLDKDFVDSIITDTDAKLTIKTPAGDKTFTQEELKKLSESAEGGVITITSSVFEEPTESDKAEKIAKAKSLIGELNLVARSSKTAKKNVKVVLKKDKTCTDAMEELKELGFTVKYRFYRSTKKSAGYKSAVTKKAASYLNTSGKKGTKYFYKIQIRVYDENGKLIAKTALKQCKYASRTWTK